jgi:hypothetical protein
VGGGSGGRRGGLGFWSFVLRLRGARLAGPGLKNQ